MFDLTVVHVASCFLGASPSPTHASVLLSSPTQGQRWFSDMPSCFHHSSPISSCAPCRHCPVSYFDVRSIFIPQRRYIPLKKVQWDQRLVWFFFPTAARLVDFRAPWFRGGHLSDLLKWRSFRESPFFQSFTGSGPLSGVSWSKCRRHTESWVSLPVAATEKNLPERNVKSARGSGHFVVQNQANPIQLHAHAFSEQERTLQDFFIFYFHTDFFLCWLQSFYC